MGEIARSDNVQSLHFSEAGELFQVHVLARRPAVRAVDLKVSKNMHWKCQRPNKCLCVYKMTFAWTGLFISGSKRPGFEREGQPLPNEVRVFLNLFVESKELEMVTDSLVKLSEVTDVYEVTGEYDIVCLLRTESILAFREVLKNKVLKIPGVKSTVSAIVLYTHKRDRKAVSE